jgi:hypothetical protein
MSMMSMHNAHEESLKKSDRGRRGLEEQESPSDCRGKPMTARCPSWLRLVDRTHYEVVEERAKLVREIFADSAAGIGAHIITRRRNEANVEAFEGKNGWQRSSVRSLPRGLQR